MDTIKIISEVIQTLGFPIAMVIYMAWNNNKLSDKYDKALEQSTQAINQMTTAIEGLKEKIKEEH